MEEQPSISAVPKAVADTIEGGGDLKTLVEKNIKWSQALYDQNQKILRRMTMMTIANYLRLALFVIPLIFALVYLPSLFKQYIGSYQELLGNSKGQNNSGSLQELFSQFTEQQKAAQK